MSGRGPLRAAILLACACLGAPPSAADDPPAPPPTICDDAGCRELTFGEHVRAAGEHRANRLAGPDAETAWVTIDAASFGRIGLDIETLAAKEPVEPDLDGTTTSGLDRERLQALLRLMEAADQEARIVTKAAKEPVTPDADPRAPTLSPPPPTEVRPPDDRGFLDVVLVGSADGYHCTGILVAPDAVLTAAHCLPATEIAVALRTDARFAHVAVRDSVPHPTLDAALVRIAAPLPLVVRSRRRATDHRDPVGTVRLVGFGVDDVRHPSSFGVKRRVDADVTGWGCDRSRARTSGCRSDAELVLTAVGGGDTCSGDSGGPVLEPDTGGYRLIAITSRPTRGGGSMCGRGGIYVRVDVLDGWLNQRLKERP